MSTFGQSDASRSQSDRRSEAVGLGDAHIAAPAGGGDDKWSKAFQNLSKTHGGPPPVRNDRSFGERSAAREGGMEGGWGGTGVRRDEGPPPVVRREGARWVGEDAGERREGSLGGERHYRWAPSLYVHLELALQFRLYVKRLLPHLSAGPYLGEEWERSDRALALTA
eukprot:gene31770-38401_t